jgi:glucose-6-phosphate 1-dehydrogenase
MKQTVKLDLEPAIITIFGITGDLSQRYLLPALHQLFKEGLLDEKTRVVGVTRGDTTAEQLFEKADFEASPAMRERTSMFKMNLDDPAGYTALLQKLNAIEDEEGVCMNRIYYLSIPPQAYSPVIELMGEQGLNQSCQHGTAMTRLLVEKPFGYDLASAEALIAETGRFFGEDQIYRIDHYMAKETVQNILTFRFKNPIFEDLWNKDHITSIEISAKEKIGIEGRANFYESIGALRDFIQSHLVQILGIVTMDEPDSLDSDPIHRSKQTVLDQVEIVPADKVAERAVRGQYEGYRNEVANPDSNTETYASLTVYINNPRWQGVPITMTTGKGLDERKTEVKVSFTHEDDDDARNEVRFRIQPNEGIEVDLVTKKPGYNYETQATAMSYSYSDEFVSSSYNNAYERVIVDAVRGDHTLFASAEEVLASWRIVQPVLDAWRHEDLKTYKSGSRGPGEPNAT